MTALPSDPEAAADALIAAFAGRSTRQRLVLPIVPPHALSEDELQEQLCAVLQAGSSTYADLPLVEAMPTLVARFADPQLAAVIANIDAFDVTRLRSATVPWLGGDLAFLPHRHNRIEVPFFVSDDGITLCGRTNEWIYAAMASRPSPQLGAVAMAYARFFFSTVVGQLGAFRFADRVDDAAWLPEATDDTKQKFVKKLQRLRAVRIARDGRVELRGTVIFKNALFSTSVMIAPNWEMELTKERLLMEELPIVFGPKFDLLVRR